MSRAGGMGSSNPRLGSCHGFAAKIWSQSGLFASETAFLVVACTTWETSSSGYPIPGPLVKTIKSKSTKVHPQRRAKTQTTQGQVQQNRFQAQV